MHFQDLILNLQRYWNERGCLLIQPYDLEKGAGTFNPSTFLRSLGPEPFSAAYAEPCRRPADGRYGDNPIRMQHYYQFQVILKPNPPDILEQYLGSLEAIGIDPRKHDVRFVHDDWESPTLGAWGLGWEVWLDGMEITQFTYFQQVGGIELAPITGEITYGLERICMYLQKKNSVFDLSYNGDVTYGDLFHQNEVQFSKHNFEVADVDLHRDSFERYEKECGKLCDAGLPAPAYDYCIKASHSFNLLDARGAISVNERQGYILRVRTLARQVAETWLEHRKELGFPMLKKPDGAPSAVLSPAAEIEAGSAGGPGAGAVGNGAGFPSDATADDAFHKKVQSAAKAFAQPSMEQVTAPVLIELGVEEMPARVFGPLLEQLPRLLDKNLSGTLLEPKDVRVDATPRRIAISIGSLKCRQPDRKLEMKGPPARVAKDAKGQWTKAAEAFAKKNGLTINQLELREEKGGEYLFAIVEQKGRTAVEILSELIPKLFSELHWYKTMRWGTGTTPFVRPVKWLAALLEDKVIPARFAGIESSDQSWGHRFLHNRPVKVKAERDTYMKALEKAHVFVDIEKRKSLIREMIVQVAAPKGLSWREDAALLEQVCYLVENPVPILGSFDERYLQVPEEVLVSEMREHQKYFALVDNQGHLANHFVTMSNLISPEPALIREGNEKVLVSRFSDAEFFLHEDRKRKLHERLEDLKKVTFLADLGNESSSYSKVQRFTKVALVLSERLGLDSGRRAQVEQIAQLCKNDLTTAMVGEFPELQGIMGRYYALGEGLDPVVADGIRDHYAPKGAGDAPPDSDEAALVGLADRLDSLVGLFAAGKLPTGSADPFALRRAAWSSIVIVVSRGFSLDIRDAFRIALDAFPAGHFPGLDPDALLSQLSDFVLARAKQLFQEKERPGIPSGFAWDTVDAVVQSSQGWQNFTDLAARLKAMQTFRRQEGFSAVASTFKRVSNILKEPVEGSPDAALFRQEEEKALLAALSISQQEVSVHRDKKDYLGVLRSIMPLQKVVDRFFDGVRVNEDEEALRLNRQRLLQAVRDLVFQVADFSTIQEG